MMRTVTVNAVHEFDASGVFRAQNPATVEFTTFCPGQPTDSSSTPREAVSTCAQQW